MSEPSSGAVRGPFQLANTRPGGVRSRAFPTLPRTECRRGGGGRAVECWKKGMLSGRRARLWETVKW